MEGHSSITTTVSLSEGVSSHASEEVNQNPPLQQLLGNGLELLMQDYQEEDQDVPALPIVQEPEAEDVPIDVVIPAVVLEEP